MIHRIRIQNVASLNDVEVEFSPVTVLIGRSGSGKSNFVNALKHFCGLIGRAQDEILVQPIFMNSSVFSYAIDFAIRDTELFRYEYRSSWPNTHFPQHELLCRNGTEVFSFDSEKGWLVPLPSSLPNSTNRPWLSIVTSSAHVIHAQTALTREIGFYSFNGSLPSNNFEKYGTNLGDNGANLRAAITGINRNLVHPDHWTRIKSAINAAFPEILDLLPSFTDEPFLSAGYKKNGTLRWVPFDRESEGIRRFLEIMVALYQTPSRLTMVFEEPEKGMHPAAVEVLANEFKSCPAEGRGQVILTTHSPHLLDCFDAESIRVAEMRDGKTVIGPLATSQRDALQEQLLRPGELLDIDLARLEDSQSVVESRCCR